MSGRGGLCWDPLSCLSFLWAAEPRTQLAAVQLAPRLVHEAMWAAGHEPVLTCPVKHVRRTCSREAVRGPREHDFVGDAGFLLLLGILPGT